MPSWYYDKKAFLDTPSIQDGLDYSTEFRYRKEGARFIIDIGTGMDLGYNTLATGVVFFHRFYMFHSFKTFPRYVTACCCLFLAGKVEETPKKCKDIIKVAKNFLNAEKFLCFGEDPKEEVMTLEKILLQTIKFDLKVQHPYSFLTKYAKCLKGDETRLQKMVQMAWTFINDSLCTTLSIQWEPEIIAIAVMYLAGKLSKFKIIGWHGRKMHHLTWWDMFVEDLEMDVLEDICHQVLDLYSPVKNVLNSPIKDKIEMKSGDNIVEPNNNSISNYTDPAVIPTSVVFSKNEPIQDDSIPNIYIKTEVLDSPKSTSFKTTKQSSRTWASRKEQHCSSFSMPNFSIPPPKFSSTNDNGESQKSENSRKINNVLKVQRSSNDSDNWLKNLSIHLRNQKQQNRRLSLDPRSLNNNYPKRSCTYFEKGTSMRNGNNYFHKNIFRDNMNSSFKRKTPGPCNNSRRFYSPSQA